MSRGAAVFSVLLLLVSSACRQRASAPRQPSLASIATPPPQSTPTPLSLGHSLPPGVSEPIPITQVRPDLGGVRTRRPWGAVLLEVLVNEEGAVAEVTVKKPGPEALNAAAVTAVRQWRYKPALKDGRPVAVRIPVSISYHPAM